MDCKNARLLLEFAPPLPGELETAEAEALEKHLSMCAECDRLSDSRQEFDQVIGRAMTAVEVPDSLRVRLMGKLQRQRDAWYRRLYLRRVLPAAAALLLIAFAGWMWMHGQRTVIQPAEMVVDFNRVHQFTERSQVERWLRAEAGEDFSAPPQFEYGLFDDGGFSYVANHRVPTLVFLRSEGGQAHTARVYILSDRHFDFSNLEAKSGSKTGLPGTVRYAILKHPKNNHVRYLVFYTGTSLRSFFESSDGHGG